MHILFSFSPLYITQAFGGAGVSQDFALVALYKRCRTLRIADGPDEVHLQKVAKLEMRNRSKL